MLLITNLKLNINHTEQQLENKIKKVLKIKNDFSYKIVKKSIDARNKNNITFVYNIHLNIENEENFLKYNNVVKVKEKKYIISKCTSEVRPIVIGFGPAGIFCSYILAKSGLKPIILERGSNVIDRVKIVEDFKKNRILSQECNIQFGEGGAGTFSDGKLTTGIKDFRIKEVLKLLVKFGAPKEILYVNKPHIGTDKLVNVIKNIRNEIISLGADIRFDNKVDDFIISKNKILGVKIINNNKKYILNSNYIVLATGHSSRDIFEKLYKNEVYMEAKPFSVGVRIEHKQSFINKCQFGNENLQKILGQAEYKASVHLKNGKSVYTFCMCPGGEVVPASSEKNRLCVNGMSNYNRDNINSNSALLVTVDEKDFLDLLKTNEKSPLNGLKFQRILEERAFKLGGSNYNAPIQLVSDFMNNVESKQIGTVEPTYKPGVTFSNLNNIFPKIILESLKEGLIEIDKKMHGFLQKDAILTGVETRSSSPIKIIRNKSFDSNISGLIPCGEGSGYAGGIMSASVDGMKCAEEIIFRIKEGVKN